MELHENNKGENKMKIDVTENGLIRLKEVFNSILFETEEGNKLIVCMRDGGFEIGINNISIKSCENYYSWYRATNGDIQYLISQEQKEG